MANVIVEPHFTLKQAVDRFFPDGQLTVASLRGEIRKGRLRARQRTPIGL